MSRTKSPWYENNPHPKDRNAAEYNHTIPLALEQIYPYTFRDLAYIRKECDTEMCMRWDGQYMQNRPYFGMIKVVMNNPKVSETRLRHLYPYIDKWLFNEIWGPTIPKMRLVAVPWCDIGIFHRSPLQPWCVNPYHMIPRFERWSTWQCESFLTLPEDVRATIKKRSKAFGVQMEQFDIPISAHSSFVQKSPSALKYEEMKRKGIV